MLSLLCPIHYQHICQIAAHCWACWLFFPEVLHFLSEIVSRCHPSKVHISQSWWPCSPKKLIQLLCCPF